MKFYLLISFLLLSTILSSQCETYEYDNIFDASWLSCETAEHPALDSAQHWIQYDLGQIRNLDKTHFWNYNIDGETASGVKEIAIYTSVNSTSWSLKAIDTIDIASGLLSYEGQEGPNLNNQPARFVLIAINNTYGNSCSGLSEVKIQFGENLDTDLQLSANISRELCTDTSSIQVSLNATGGNGPYSFEWSTGHDSAFVDGIDVGNHQVIVRDALNQREVFNLTIDSIAQDSTELLSGFIESKIHVRDTIESDGLVQQQSDVSFLFSGEVELKEGFSVLKTGEFLIDFYQCLQDSSHNFEIVKALYYSLTKGSNREFIGLGNTSNITTISSNEDNTSKSFYSINGRGLLDDRAAARFLSQATLGYDTLMISEVAELGIEEWINQQIEIESNSYFDHFRHIVRRGQPTIKYYEDFHRTWWHNTLTSDEYLRERVAFALSQIFVISSKSFLLNYGDGMTAYYDMLLKNSFGNYRDLLYDVTLNPMMGFYLSHLNNAKTDAALNRFPDENYAREILQLFSIGLYELNINGTRKKDSFGQDIPTYNNENIIEFAKVFTGLSFTGRDFGTSGNQQGLPYTLPMQMNEEQHEMGIKLLLNGESIDSGQTGLEDINDALDNIFNHPNVGPFISIRLIQRLVKSEPSPEYIQRVAEVFNDNGSGVRGDLKAVVKAILLDNEARNCEFLDDPTHGMLREPLPRIIHLLKAFGISNTTNNFYALGTHIEDLTHQAPLRAPSVFNFYQPDHTAPGVLSDSMVRSPEFAILDSYSSIGYLNLVDSISANIGVLDVEEGLATLDFSEELAAAFDANSLINILDKKLTYGHLSERTKNIMEESINLVGADPADRVRMAIYIIANSPDYTILR